MSAEEELIDSLMHPPYIGDGRYGCDEDEARELVRDYAHELAEKIREDTTVMGEAGDQYALAYADLIDPKKKVTD